MTTQLLCSLSVCTRLHRGREGGREGRGGKRREGGSEGGREGGRKGGSERKEGYNAKQLQLHKSIDINDVHHKKIHRDEGREGGKEDGKKKAICLIPNA